MFANQASLRSLMRPNWLCLLKDSSGLFSNLIYFSTANLHSVFVVEMVC